MARSVRADQTSTKRVFLWSTPRSVSTAFEIAFRNLPNVQAFHEPFTIPHYLAQPMKTLKLVSDTVYTFQDAAKLLQTDYPDKDTIFAKTLTNNITGQFDMLLEDGYREFTHSFLIRNPKKAIVSYYKMLGDLNAFEESHERGEFGFQASLDLYHFLKTSFGVDPVIVDADDLLDNPEGIMKAYCERVGLTYKEGMTKWESGSKGTKELIDQKMGMFELKWEEAAIKSNGISKPSTSSSMPDDLPPVVMESIEKCLIPYNELYQLRLVL